MSKFAQLLKRYRADLGLSAELLAKEIGKSQQYISGLENGKKPSNTALPDLIRVLAKTRMPDNVEFYDQEKARKLLVAALELDDLMPEVSDEPASRSLTQEILDQLNLERESEVWIVSDLLAEAVDEQALENTAKAIRERNISYSYFLPFNSGSDWKLVRRQLELQLEGDTDLTDYVRFYHISNCGSLVRMRISNPNSNRPTASYTLDAPEESKGRFRFFPAPRTSVENAVKTLRFLTELETLDGSNHPNSPVMDPENGSILKLYPKS